MRYCLLLMSIGLHCQSACMAEEQVVPTPRPIPLTRPIMKEQLEDLKGRSPRIPLPAVPEETVAGDLRHFSYEMRLREAYLPPGSPSVVYANLLPPPGTRPADSTPPRTRDFTRNADEAMTLSYAFKTRLFWIVSRVNNCHYCLGHQEQKLSAVGMSDEQIATLDLDWLQHPAHERPAFAYARRLTWEPHLIEDADFVELRAHYTDLQILEMTLSIAWNNAINRWKEGLGVPQSQHGEMFFRNRSPDIPVDRLLPVDTFLTPTAPEHRAARSIVVAAAEPELAAPKLAQGATSRPQLESTDDVRSHLAAAATRHARFPLVDEVTARERLGTNAPAGSLPNFVLLLANFPNDGGGRVPALLELTSDTGVLTSLQKAQVAWLVARQDRAWYAVGQAYARLRELGQSDEQIFLLDGDRSHLPALDRAILNFAGQLAMSPIALTDEQFAELLALSNPETCVQLVNYVAGRVYFNRVTEAAGLPAGGGHRSLKPGLTDHSVAGMLVSDGGTHGLTAISGTR
ncbi:MAG: hypothetical protein R3B90_23590 [Planctomycetaceae bacterium]